MLVILQHLSLMRVPELFCPEHKLASVQLHTFAAPVEGIALCLSLQDGIVEQWLFHRAQVIALVLEALHRLLLKAKCKSCDQSKHKQMNSPEVLSADNYWSP